MQVDLVKHSYTTPYGDEEMHDSTKVEGWTPLISGITVKGEGDAGIHSARNE